MSKLSEPFVKYTALEYLKNHYQNLYEFDEVYSNDEVYTIKRLRGRADGLLCFNSEKQSLHTVSIEAKSHKTLSNLFSFVNYEKMDVHLFYVSCIIALISSYFLWQLSWYYLLIYVILSTGIIWFVFLFITGRIELNKYKSAMVVSQIDRYPANEKWIAVSKDSLNLLRAKEGFVKGDNKEELIKLCRKKGIGIIVINKVEPTIILHPKYFKGDFLSNYKRRSEIEIVLKA